MRNEPIDARKGHQTEAILFGLVPVGEPRTAAEALILENQLIKALKPRFNILMRDDKSYPYLLLTQEAWPRLVYHRGGRSRPGRYFGPYPGTFAVRDTLELMSKLFRLRTCEDSVFRNRTRPCLQHQIGRCSAPCVGLVGEAEYRDAVRRVALFLEGRSDEVMGELGQAMDAAAQALDFETAAALRDQIAAIRKVQARQYVDGDRAELDVVACVLEAGLAAVVVLSFRDGTNLGTQSHAMRVERDVDEAEVLGAYGPHETVTAFEVTAVLGAHGDGDAAGELDHLRIADPVRDGIDDFVLGVEDSDEGGHDGLFGAAGGDDVFRAHGAAVVFFGIPDDGALEGGDAVRRGVLDVAGVEHGGAGDDGIEGCFRLRLASSQMDDRLALVAELRGRLVQFQGD